MNRKHFFKFLFLTGFICVDVKPQRQDQLFKPPCNASHENLGTAGKLSLNIPVSKLDFSTGMGLYVGSSHSMIRLEVVKSPCTLLIFSLWKLLIYRGCEQNRIQDVSFVNDFCFTGVTDVSLHFIRLLACLSLLNDQKCPAWEVTE